MAVTSIKGGTECGNIWVKNPIYSAPAVKGLKPLFRRLVFARMIINVDSIAL